MTVKRSRTAKWIGLAGIGLIGLLGAPREAHATVIAFVAVMNGAQTVPARTTSASGSAEFVLDTDKKTLNGTVRLNGVDVTHQHAVNFELGGCGEQPNTPRYMLPPPNAEGVITVQNLNVAEFMSELRTGNIYIIVRTAAQPAGEIRGQVLKRGWTDTCPVPPRGGGGAPGARKSK